MTPLHVDTAWFKSAGSRILYELDPKRPVLYVNPANLFLESSQWSPFEISGLGPMVCARNSPTRSPTARHAPESVVLCGMPGYYAMGSGLVPLDVIYCFVQVNSKIPGDSEIYFFMRFSNIVLAL